MPALLIAITLAAPLSFPPAAPPPDQAQSWSCTPRRTCSRIATCEEAMWYLHQCSWGSRLDRDSDGIPCETICRGATQPL